MKIAFISLSKASDIHSWSGLPYHISRSLEMQNGVEVVYIDDLAQANKGLPFYIQGLKKFLFKKLGKHIDIKLFSWRLKRIASDIERKLPADIDVIFSDSSITLAYLNTLLPKVFYTDATFGGMLGFYRPASAMAKETIRNGNKMEKLAIDKCSLGIYSSDWAAASAVKFYETDPAKIKVIPFGANIECNRTSEDIDIINHRRAESHVCNLLFLGVDWKRKGGDFAIEVVKGLNRAGVTAKLHIAGSPEAAKKQSEYVINHGFISKREHNGRQALDKLMEDSHFLILPTKADCTPIVYGEANSFGLPVLTSDVGGIKTVIKDESNGKAFPLSASVEDYVQYIRSVFSDKDRYKSLASSSFREYKERLNWEVAGKRIVELLNNIK